jgi:hypothetical protein
MGAVCDVYDAITSNRPYKAGWDPAESIARMASRGRATSTTPCSAPSSRAWASTRWARWCGWSRAGWRWWSSRTRAALTAPVVKVFFSTKSNMPVSVLRLDLSAGANDRIVGRESPATWGFKNLDHLWADPLNQALRCADGYRVARRRTASR